MAATAMVEQPRYAFIDALRGVAVLMVVAAHTPVPASTPELGVLGATGGYGVQLFFIVSAFTLFMSLDAKWQKEPRAVLSFFIRRFFRIAPAFYAAAVFYLLKDGFGPRPFAPDGIGLRQLLTTALFVNGWQPDTINAVVPGGWSIAVEMTFYLVVPSLFLLVTTPMKAFGLSVVLGIVGSIVTARLSPLLMTDAPGTETVNAWFPRLWFPAQACVFPIGMALYWIHRKGVVVLGSGAALGLVLLSAFLTLGFASTEFYLVTPQFLIAVALGVGCFALSQRPLPLLVNPVMRHVGKVSFSVYLLHFWVIDLVKLYLAPYWASLHPYVGYVLFYASVTALTCLAATVTYELVERPGQGLGRAIIAAMQRRSAAVTPADGPDRSYRAPK